MCACARAITHSPSSTPFSISIFWTSYSFFFGCCRCCCCFFSLQTIHTFISKNKKLAQDRVGEKTTITTIKSIQNKNEAHLFDAVICKLLYFASTLYFGLEFIVYYVLCVSWLHASISISLHSIRNIWFRCEPSSSSPIFSVDVFEPEKAKKQLCLILIDSNFVFEIISEFQIVRNPLYTYLCTKLKKDKIMAFLAPHQMQTMPHKLADYLLIKFILICSNEWATWCGVHMHNPFHFVWFRMNLWRNGNAQAQRKFTHSSFNAINARRKNQRKRAKNTVENKFAFAAWNKCAPYTLHTLYQPQQRCLPCNAWPDSEN